MSLQDYLIEFKAVAAEWFEGCAFIKDNYDFFTEFFKKENLIKAKWSDFQAIGNHIHAFNSMAIAMKNALGRMNHPVEHYRNSFIYLVHGEGTVEERINNFVYDKRYKIKYFGSSVISELLGYIFADQFVLYNRRDKFALEFLGIDPGFSRGDKLDQKFLKFNIAIKHVIEEYKKVVGKNIDTPVNLEVDQFFSYLYKKYGGGYGSEDDAIKYWQIAPGENAKFWDEFKKLSIAAVGFKNINMDLSGISESKFKSLFQKHYPDKKTIKRTQLWNFINLKPGNKFITNKGKSLLLGAGEVKSGYQYRPEREEFKHTIDVEYYRLSEDGILIPDKFKGKFGKTITKLKKEDFDILESLLPPPPPNIGPYSIEKALETVFVKEKHFRNIVDLLNYKKNIIIKGPPGVGKTFIAKYIA